MTKKFAGPGVALAEGKEWKRKRKILVDVFNFDSIKDSIPYMLKKVNNSF